jgi:hypothetical protein
VLRPRRADRIWLIPAYTAMVESLFWVVNLVRRKFWNVNDLRGPQEFAVGSE